MVSECLGLPDSRTPGLLLESCLPPMFLSWASCCQTGCLPDWLLIRFGEFLLLLLLMLLLGAVALAVAVAFAFAVAV